MRVGQHLDLDVARILDVLLDVDRRRRRSRPGPGAARSRARARRRPPRRRPSCRAPPPPAEALIAIGQPYCSPSSIDGRGVADLARWCRARSARRPPSMRCRAPILEPIASIAVGRRADPDEPGLGAGARERGVLGQEAVARDGSPRRPLARAASMIALDVQVALGRRARPDQAGLVGAAHVQRAAIGLGVDGDGADCRARAARGRHGWRSRRDWRRAPCERAGAWGRESRRPGREGARLADYPGGSASAAGGANPSRGGWKDSNPLWVMVQVVR